MAEPESPTLRPLPAKAGGPVPRQRRRKEQQREVTPIPPLVGWPLTLITSRVYRCTSELAVSSTGEALPLNKCWVSRHRLHTDQSIRRL